ncbi:probable peroxisomal acyl-coenzyme A oxidase 1 [Cylas formicarius]|uniref:probable peroxisomal acyl-coenzyme A oxidase 1 n=1 Tax=Cylas formicarius TaxID=197179 RepID=UPI0029584028|nr:probable peroxisomal acyl-coenzyme A oxidase 1 [Cylas formicarius]
MTLRNSNPILVNHGMFIPTIVGQGTPDQQAKWLARASNFQIIGTYAQTELGHGTNVRGLETTATYDPSTEEFVLNTPTLSAYKWWPAGLGHTVNHAILVAQLEANGKRYGVHTFVVQLRDEETHMPLPGVTIGEIGPKLGMNGTNQGFLALAKVRIPRANMLMRHSQVLPDGTYVSSPNRALTYNAMLFVRLLIIYQSAWYLKRAVTIVTRYSAVRRQGGAKRGVELQIMDYRTQQQKIFPYIATCFAFQYVGDWLWNVYNEVNAELDTGKLENLPELHSLSCVFKAITSADAAAGIEICRLACGGHGYMQASNLPILYGLATAMVTYEGENTVLLLQTARYLIKVWQSGNLSRIPSVNYLNTALQTKRPFERSVEWIIFALRRAFTSLITRADQGLRDRMASGQTKEDAWNNTSIDLVEAADHYGRSFIVEAFHERVGKLSVSAALKSVLNQLDELYAVSTALKLKGSLLRFADISERHLITLQAWLEDLLAVIRPNAVGIVDSFDIRDEILASALGSYDGNVYERLYTEARKSMLNSEPVNESFHLYLKPFMRSNL